MFLLYRLSLHGAPIGVGAPGFSRSEPIVVTPLHDWTDGTKKRWSRLFVYAYM
jgi:hypothetical protein